MGKKFEFDLTSYAYDRSASGFRGEEDRRFAVSVSSGLQVFEITTVYFYCAQPLKWTISH